MRLIDTVVLVGALNPADRHHEAAERHLSSLEPRKDTMIPASSLIEFDLIMKAREYTPKEMSDTWSALTGLVEPTKALGITPGALMEAAMLRQRGLDYFDSLIAGLAISSGATVVTNDRAIGRFVETEW